MKILKMEEITNSEILEEPKMPPTIYIVKFSSNTSIDAVKWFLRNIEDFGKNHFADLVMKCEPNIRSEHGITIHVSATKLLHSAAWYSQTLSQNLKAQEIEFLSEAEREFCIRNILMKTRAKIKEKIPGHENIIIHPGQSLVSVFQDELLIDRMFPLHNTNKLENIANEWCYEFSIKVPKAVQSYFGEAIAMYFHFLQYYTMMLIFPATLGALLHMFAVDSLTENTMFAIFNCVWITIFLKIWKRKCSALAFDWGTLSRSDDEEIQPHFSGEVRLNEITQQHEPYYPMWKTYCKIFSSTLIVGSCTLLAIILGVLFASGSLLSWVGIGIGLTSKIVYRVIIAIANGYYKKLAAYLTRWENHRLEGSYSWHYVSKLLVFEFVNNFTTLFYFAFYDQDWKKLREWVANMLIVMQLINQFQETVFPYLIKGSSSIVKTFISIMHSSRNHIEGLSSLDVYDLRIEQAEMEAKKDSVDDAAFEDYLEMFMQFGYVSMFSCAYPMAAFWALINNLTEIKLDAFKFCNVYQRPKVKRVSTIGVWQDAFEMLGVIGVATNCALLCLSPTNNGKTIQTSCESSQFGHEWILLFVLLEHLIFGLKFMFSYIIPDQPKSVRDKQEAILHQAKAARTEMILKKVKSSPLG